MEASPKHEKAGSRKRKIEQEDKGLNEEWTAKYFFTCDRGKWTAKYFFTCDRGKWTAKYFFTCDRGKCLCLFCHEIIAVNKEHNLKRHF